MMLTILSSTDLGKLPWRSILEFLQQNFNTMLLNCQLIIELHWGTSGQTGTEKSIISMIDKFELLNPRLDGFFFLSRSTFELLAHCDMVFCSPVFAYMLS